MLPHTEKEQVCDIGNGPSKMDLLLALFDPYPSGKNSGRRTVMFTVFTDGNRFVTIPFVIDGVRQGGPNDRTSKEQNDDWILTGYAPKCSYGEHVRIEARFSTQRRTGIVRFFL